MVFQKRTKENREEQKEAKKLQKLKFKEKIKNFIKNKKAVAMVIEYILTIECFTMLFLLTTPIETKAETYTDGYGIKWEYTLSNNKATNVYISSGTLSSTTLTIPSYLNRYSVISLKSNAFTNCGGYKNLTNIYIPSTVTNIRSNTFSGCTGLTSIEIPSSVTNIESNAFSGCTNLTKIKVNVNNSNYISENGILYNKDKTILIQCPAGKRKKIEIPDSVTSIGSNAFYGCSGLTEIEIPSSVTSIGSNAFYGCRGLTEIEIPSSVTSIGTYVFSGCSGLTSIEIPSSVTSIGNYVFSGCSGLMSIEIPNSVTRIGNYAFQNCSGLTSIEIPSSVTSIGGSAFSGCSRLTSIEIPSSVTSIGTYVFSGCSGLTSIEIPSSVTSIGERAFQSCRGLTSIEIPSSVTSIGGAAFYGCTGLTSIEIPSSVTSIGSYAFQSCSGLTSIEIPSSVTSIGTYVFSGCSGLTSIEIPDSVTSIGSYAFQSCSGLTSIEIPSSVTSIGTYVFSGCSGLMSIEIPNSVTSIGNYAFQNCSGLTSIEIPSSVTSIETYAFSGCTSITTINIDKNNSSYSSEEGIVYNKTKTTLVIYPQGKEGDIIIPNKITSIGQYAFLECKKLTGITIGNSVTSIGNYAFSGCIGLKKITMPGTATIGINAFFNVTNVEEVILTGNGAMPNYTTSTYSYTPWYTSRDKIKSITIGNGITGIGNYAFYNSTGLQDIYVNKLQSAISFGTNWNSNCYAYVHYSDCTNTISFSLAEGISIESLTNNITDGKINCRDSYSFRIINNNGNKVILKSEGLRTNEPVISKTLIPDEEGVYTINNIKRNIEIIAGEQTNGDLYEAIDENGIKWGYTYQNGEATDVYYRDGTIGEKIIVPSYLEGLKVVSIGRNSESYNILNTTSSNTTVTEIILPDTLETIGNYALSRFTGIINIEIPSSVTSIGKSAFYNCTGLTDIHIDKYESEITVGTNWNDNSFIHYKGCKQTVKIDNDPKEELNFEEITHNLIDNKIECKDIYKFKLKDKSGNTVYNRTINIVSQGLRTNLSNVTNELLPNEEGIYTIENIYRDITICIGRIAGRAYSAEDINRITWSYTYEDGKATDVYISYGSGGSLASTVIIPSYLDEYPVVSVIGYKYNEAPGSYSYRNMFYSKSGENNTTINRIILPETLQEIKESAFENCTGLTSIEIPDSVTSIGSGAFSGCTGLTSINIPNSVTSIGGSAFSGCSRLTSIEIPSSVTNIGNYAFKNCTSLTSIEIPSSVTSLNGFSGCTGLTSIEIPSSVTNIGSSAFSGCTGLTSIEIPSSVTNIGSSAFSGCTGLTSINIPSSVTSIGSSAFSGCTGLTSINIPNSVTSIESSVFYGCRSLTSIEIPDSVTSIGQSAFRECTGLTEIEIPNSVTNIGNYAFTYCTSLTSIEIPNSVTSIESNAFYGCTRLTSIEIPSSVTNIGNQAFQNCNGLTSIEIPSSVTSIESYAFQNCSGLTSIEIPSSVTSIGERAFQGCTGLTSIEIPDSVTSIGTYAVQGCSGLKKITMPGTIVISQYIFNNVTNVEEVILTGEGAIPDYTTSTYQYTPWYISRNKIKNITIGDGITRIGDYTFYNCTGLTDIYIDKLQSEITFGSNWNSSCYAYVHYSDCAHTVTTSLIDGTSIEEVTDNLTDGKINCSENYSFKIINNNEENSYKVISKSEGLRNNEASISRIIAPDENGIYTINNVNRNIEIIVGDIQNGQQFQTEDENGIAWSYIYQDGVATNVYCLSEIQTETLTIPAYLDGVQVVSIGRNNGSNNIFNTTSNTTVKEVILPDTLIEIGNYAFYSCTGLTSIEIPDGVTSIGNYAFQNCSGLTDICINRLQSEITLGTNWNSSCYAFIHYSDCTHTITTTLSEGIYIENVTDNITDGKIKCGEDYSFKLVDSEGELVRNVRVTMTSQGLKTNSGNIAEAISVDDEGIYTIKNIKRNKTITAEYFVNGKTYQETDENGITWSYIYQDGVATNLYKTGGTLSATLRIPAYLGGIPVVSIGRNSGSNNILNTTSSNTTVTEIILPDTLETIGNYALSRFTGIINIEIPSSVTSIGNNAFYNCTGLTNIEMSSMLTSIGDYAFQSCTGLTNIEIPESVITIGRYAFYQCSNITGSINVPSSVITIGQYAFDYCSKLTEIYVDNEEKDVNFENYWDGQNSLIYVHYKNHMHNINIEVEEGFHIEEIEGSIENNNIVCQSEYKFRLLDEENNVVKNKPVIMEKSLKIEKRMPWGSVNTKDLPREAKRLIPDEEGVYTIEDIDTVRNITLTVGLVNGVVDEWTDSNGITWSYTFENKEARALKYISGDLSNIDVLEVPDKTNGFVVISLADEAFKGLELKKVILPDSIINIGKEAFSGCTTLEEVVLPVDLTFISDYAFSGCTSLGEMELPEKIEVIGNYAFNNCSNLEMDLTLKSGMKTIGENAFKNCSSLVGELVLPSRFLQISNGAFTNCRGITAIRIQKYTGEEPIDQLVVNFKQGVSLNTITEDTRKYSQTGIEKSVLAETDGGNILNLILDENGKPIVTVSKIINIGSGAFKGCTSLTKVYLPEGTKQINYQSGLGFNNELDIYVDMNKGEVTEYIESNTLKEVNVHYKGEKHSVEFTGKAILNGYSIQTIEGNLNEGKIACESIYKFKVLNNEQIPVTDIQVRTKKPAQDISDARILTANEEGIYSITVKSDLEIIVGTGNGDTFTCEVEDIIWSYTYADGKATNVYYKSGILEDNIIIPTYLNELPVVSIYNKENGNNQYNIFGQYQYSITDVEEIILPNTLEEIGNYAFAGCKNLTNITIPESVTKIGQSAFYNCSGLTTIEIPESVESIDNWAFSSCSGLTGNITLSSNVTYIGSGAFSAGSKLTDIYINNNEADIKKNGEISNYSSVHFLDHKHSITINNDPREKVTVETVDGNLVDGQILCKDTYKFKLLDQEGNVIRDKTIKLLTTKLQYQGWGYATVIDTNEEILPNEEGIYTIDSIIRDYIICTGAVNGETKTFEDEQGITWQYTYEDEKARALKYISGDLNEIETLEVPDKVDGLIVTTLANEALKGQTSLENVVFPDSITNIGQSAFEGCTSLETAVLPDELEIISTKAFKGCSNLLTVELPDSLIAIGDEAFSGCNDLSMDLSIKNGLKVIGKESFKDCTSLTGELVLPETLFQIGTGAFSGCTGITRVIIMPYTGNIDIDVSNIGYSDNISMNINESATAENFLGNTSAISYGNLVVKDEYGQNINVVDEYGLPVKAYTRTVKIGRNAFSGCTVLEEMDVQAKVDAVDGNIISECPNLKDVYIASKSTEMAALNVPEGVTVHYLDSVQEVEIEAIEGAIIEVISGADEEGNAYCQSDYKFKVNIAKGSSYKGVVVKVGNKGEEKEVIKPDEDGIYTIARVLKDQEIEIIEGRTVEIKYVDNSGKEIAKSKIIAGLEGESYTTQSKEIQYYKWNGAIPENAEGVYTEEDIIVIYVYDNLPSGVITVKYVDKDGNEISDAEKVQGNQGETYEILRKNIKGYKAYGVTPENAKGMFTEEDVEVIFLYEAIEEETVVKYVDEEGNYIARDKTVYDNEEIEAKDIDGYKNTGKEEDGKEITYTYEDTRNRSSKWTTEQTLLVIAGIIIVLTVTFIIIARREKRK